MNEHRWVCSGAPDDDDPWCGDCGIPIDDGFGKPCNAVKVGAAPKMDAEARWYALHDGWVS